MKKTILLIEDDASGRQVLDFRLQQAGYQVITAVDGQQGYQLFTEHFPDLVITDMAMPAMNGLELTQQIKLIAPDIPIIVVTAFGDVQTAVTAIKSGAADYLTKPLNWEELKVIIERCLNLQELLHENRRLQALVTERFQFDNIIGSAKSMQAIYNLLARVARTDVTVLLLGESGTGKELVAKSLHHHSLRSLKSFVTIDCSAIPEQLLESELFGHRKGAFTGAVYDKRGLFEEAQHGTVFLDEIGELPLKLQAKLLRVLQDGEFMRLGETQQRRVNVRIIAATNRHLAKMVAAGEFREDLFFRLNIMPIKLPPLRERREDIPLLVNNFLNETAQRHQLPKPQISPEVYQAFNRYPWPGNVRELRNTVERLVILAGEAPVTEADLPDEIRAIATAPNSLLPFALPPATLDLEQLEREIIRQALIKHQWNQTHTAKYLNITRNTLIYRMQKFGLEEE
jgi:two-component system NtrC family response regulator